MPDGSGIVANHFDPATRTAAVSIRSTATFAAIGPTIVVPILIASAVSPDGKWLAVTDYNDGRKPGGVRLYDLAAGTLRKELVELNAITEDVDLLRGSGVHTLTFSGDSKRLATINHRGAAMVWDVETLQPASKAVANRRGRSPRRPSFHARRSIRCGREQSQ